MARALVVPAALLLLAAPAGADGEGDRGIVHPVLEDPSGPLMEFRGGVEAGFRFVDGDEGRYDQDLRLGQGLRLLAADVRGDALVEGLGVDSIEMRARGLGDPDTRFDFRARERETWDFSMHADRLEYGFVHGGELHPFETTRTSEGASLHLRPRKTLEVHLGTEHLQRTGDATLEQLYRDGRDLPLPARLDYDGRTWTAGFDATAGALRFGGSGAWARSTDESLRTLDPAASPPPDEVLYRNVSDASSRTWTGRAGLRLLGGRLDLSGSGGYSTAEADARVHASLLSPAPSEERGASSAEMRHRWWRGEVLALPGGDWEVLARYERRLTDERSRADLFFPTAPYFVVAGEPRARARLGRLGVEARWKASREWRFRGGLERVDERVVTRENEIESWTPKTRIATAGADWSPSDRLDASLLVRAADQRDDATQLSPGEAEGLTLRVRARDRSGDYATAFARLKDRQVDRSDSEARVNAAGIVLGRAAGEGFVEATVERRTFLVASDTRFVVDDAVNAVKSPRRVRYDEESLAAGLDFSQPVAGPLRAFGRGWWNRATGDAPWRRYDAALGVGWRLCPSTELRLEGRRVVLNEDGPYRGDYRADILTVSVLWEF